MMGRALVEGSSAGTTAIGAYTFSTSGLPSRPDGKKISVMARMLKVATSL